ncbi:MAG: hypothetical protein LQ350_000191 [Teloschistes chrysophthalmus]|nr:MAG: hypothetical protein LQ350_000191 [Niorma chrysophthalma]
MDSPDRMSWTPSSSAKKRKLAEFEHIQNSPQLHIPGTYPPSPTGDRGHYQSSPTPLPRIVPQMHNHLPAPPRFWAPLVQMVSQTGTTVTTRLSNALGIFAGPGARLAHCLRRNAAPLYVAAEAIGNTAKRVKLAVRPNRNQGTGQHASTPLEQPATPTQRTSRNMNRSPSPTLPSQTSILHHARETGLRKSRATVRWVEEQKLIEQLMHERETVDLAVVDRDPNDMQPMHDLPFAPMMTGALPMDDFEAPDDTDMFDEDVIFASHDFNHKVQAPGNTDVLDDESAFDSQDDYNSDPNPPSDDHESTSSSVSSDFTDSVTSSMLDGLTEEDMKNMETKHEKKVRIREARQAAADKIAANIQANEELAARDPTCLLAQLRALAKEFARPEPKSKVAFFKHPTNGNPVAKIKTFDSEGPITPPVKPFLRNRKARRPAIRPYVIQATVGQGAYVPSSPSSSSLSSLGSTAETPSPINVARNSSRLPEIASGLADLKVSNRRASKRQEDVELEAQLERDQAAERLARAEAERRAAEEARLEEERIRLGIRRMPINPVIQPLNDDWNAKVDGAMAVGLSSTRELARCSDGTPVTRRDLGHVLPQQGDRTAGWLNDTIINGYLQSVTEYAKKMQDVKRGELPKVHAFSSFFHESLKNRGYAGVQNWARRAKFGGKDILKMEKIFIPINKGGNHWTLVYINPQTKTIEYFDSFHHAPGGVIDNVKLWLRSELREDWVDAEWTLLQRGGPTQHNASDCGVFVTATAKMIVLGVDPMHFSAADMPAQRRVIVAELLNGGIDGALEPNVTFV